MNEGLEHDPNNMPIGKDYRTAGGGILLADAAQAVLYGKMQDVLNDVAHAAASATARTLLQEARDAGVPEPVYARLLAVAEHIGCTLDQEEGS